MIGVTTGPVVLSIDPQSGKQPPPPMINFIWGIFFQSLIVNFFIIYHVTLKFVYLEARFNEWQDLAELRR